MKNKKNRRNLNTPSPTERPRKAAMSESRFWKLIENARHGSDTCSTLSASLKKLCPEEIIAFENILQRKLAKAYTFPLLAANFVIESYVSDDVFESFRAWLVSEGRERYEAALSDPESICDWLERRRVNSVDRQGERMLFVAKDAYQRWGDEDEFGNRVKYPRKASLRQNWPENKAEFQKRYPRLVNSFWNQARIKELHS